MDNAPSHKLEEGVALKCTKIKFLPPNTTTHLQPMDAAVIANFKHHYKKLAARVQLKMIINDEPVRISPYKAVCLCKKAWDAVSAKTIEKCWFKTGLIPRPGDQQDVTATNIAITEEQIPLTEIQETLDQLQSVLPIEQVLSAEQLIAAVNDLPTEAELSIEAVDIVLSHDSEETCMNTPSVEEPSDATLPSTPAAAASVINLKTIIEHLHDIQEECMTRNDLGYITETLGSLILQIEKKQQHARTAQTSITSFFKQ